MSAQPYLGVTPPISVTLPTDAENKANSALLEELRSQGTFESPVDTEKRYKVLASLQHICDEFVRRIANKRHPNKVTLIKAARGKVFTYGSFRLGVYGPGSDIDTLVVAPKYVTREDYFEIFPQLLIEMAPPDAITDLTSVQDAFVPIIKFEYNSISIDLIFSRIAILQLPSEPDFDLRDSNLLRGLDDKELRSLNGTRVTDEILALVPEKATFRLALRAIKLWAQRRAVYANIMGFPGGVAWAMLVARVCQLYPKATSATIVGKFFEIFCMWPWPQPVLLKAVEPGPLPVRVWNPQVYKADSFHIMPVITPAYPSMCATYNISASTKKIIDRELKRGSQVATEIINGTQPWSDLFERHTFFTNGYKYYLAVISTSTNREAHNKWSGLVESKVRQLVTSMDRHDNVALAHPYVKGFERVHKCQDDSEVQKVKDGSLEFLIPKDTETKTNDAQMSKASDGKMTSEEAKNNISNGSESEKTPTQEPFEVYTLTHYIGLELKPDSKQLDLSVSVMEFKELCTKWDKYDESVNFLHVQDVRNFDLPDDVFEPGEIKPKRKLVKKIRKVPGNTTTKEAVSKKRHAEDDVTSNPKRTRPASVASKQPLESS